MAQVTRKERMTERDFTIRIGDIGDAEVLAQANIAMAWETEHKRLDPATIARGVQAVLTNPMHGFYVLACRGNQIAGSLLVTFEWSDWRSGLIWWVQSVYVQPQFRRHGAFKRLYEFVRTEASRMPDVCGIRLYVEQGNHVAQKAYARIGMEQTHYTIYEDLFPTPECGQATGGGSGNPQRET